MIERLVGDRRYLQFETLARQPGLAHAYTTNPRDLSPTAANPRAAAEREQTLRDLGLKDPPASQDPRSRGLQSARTPGHSEPRDQTSGPTIANRLYYAQQIHRTHLAVIDTPRAGGPVPDTDALITALPHTPLMTFSADCPLILAYDPRRHVVGMAHASWRCTVARLTSLLIEAMHSRFRVEPADLLVGIGPSAGPCCYEVGEDVIAAAADLPDRDRLFPTRAGRTHFDLWQANRALLVEAGVRAENVELSNLCTICRADLFPSYRRDGAGCGRFALAAGLLRH